MLLAFMSQNDLLEQENENAGRNFLRPANDPPKQISSLTYELIKAISNAEIIFGLIFNNPGS